MHRHQEVKRPSCCIHEHSILRCSAAAAERPCLRHKHRLQPPTHPYPLHIWLRVAAPALVPALVIVLEVKVILSMPPRPRPIRCPCPYQSTRDPCSERLLQANSTTTTESRRPLLRGRAVRWE